MGGDGIYDPTYIKLAGATSNGDLATSVGAPTDSLDAGKKFVADYKAAGYKEPVRGLRRLLLRRRQRHHQRPSRPRSRATARRRSRPAARRSTRSSKVSFDGVTGKVAFDEYGDTTNKVTDRLQGRRRQVGAVKTARVKSGRPFNGLTTGAASTHALAAGGDRTCRAVAHTAPCARPSLRRQHIGGLR